MEMYFSWRLIPRSTDLNSQNFTLKAVYCRLNVSMFLHEFTFDLDDIL